MNPEPLAHVTSLKGKLAVVVGASILLATAVAGIGAEAGVPAWISLPVTVAFSVLVTGWLARGTTAPLRELTAATRAMATGDYSRRVPATSTGEVGELARAFNHMASDLATVDQQRRALVATVSHELRTPLAAQRAVLENLVDGIVPTDGPTLQAALAQAERLSDLVEDLLDLSRVDSGAAQLALAPVAVRELLDEAVEEARLSGREIEHQVTVEPADLTVTVDRARLAQVVANLLDNAGRHAPRGSVVTVAAQAEASADRWSLEVTDRGPGIPAGERATVFERFGAGTGAGAATGTGRTGLGLAIARWVCELHGGSIHVHDPRDGSSGARLRVELPRVPAEVDPALNAAPNGVAPVPNSSASAPSAGRTLQQMWPERRLPTQPGLLAASAAVGVLAAVVLPDNDPGLGVFLVLLSGGLVVLRARALPGRTPVWQVWVSVALCIGLGSLVVLRADPAVAFLAIVAACALVTTTLTGARTVVGIVAGGAAWVLSGLRGLPLLSRTLQSLSKRPAIWSLVRTAALTVLLVIVFGALFSSADAVFGSWAGALVPELDWSTFTVRSFVWFLVAGVVLAGCYLALNPPSLDELVPDPRRPVTRAWEWLVPMGALLVVFASFLLAQGAALFGGHDYVRRTTGLTYADYVHQGFAQLTVVTALTLAVVSIAARCAPVQDERGRLLTRVVLGALCVMTLAVVASAMHRMDLYQQAFGFTELRILVDAFDVWLGLLVVLVLVGGLRLRARWIPQAALVSGAAILLVVGALGPAALAARANLDRYDRTGKVDLPYLATLGHEAMPAVADSRLPLDAKRCLAAELAAGGSSGGMAWNLGRARGEAAAERIRAAAADLPAPSCTEVYSQP